MKRYAPLLLLLALIPMVSAFTYNSNNFNYITPSGGTLLYGFGYTATSWGIVGTRFTWGGTVYGGANIGVVGFDPSATCTMTVTGMQLLALNYTVAAAGVQTQRIYYRGLGAPTGVTGGVAGTVGTITTVTTNGNTAVGLTWGGAAPGAGPSASGGLFDASSILFGLLPLLLLVMVSMDVKEGTLGINTVWKSVWLAMIIAAVAWMVSSWGY